MASIIGRGKAYCKQAQQIVLNVYNYFMENPAQGTTPMQETVAATGVSRPSVCKIRENGITTPKKTGTKRLRIQETVDEFDRGAIRRIIQSMYSEKVWPTVANLLDRVKNELGFQGSTLKNILRLKYGIYL